MPTVENVELYNEPNLDALQAGCSNVAATGLDNLRIRSQAMQVRILRSLQTSRRLPRTCTRACVSSQVSACKAGARGHVLTVLC